MDFPLDLSARKWTLQGWRPFYWQTRRSLETGGIFRPEFGPFPAAVPGSVHEPLRKAGVIPDWNVGRNSLACEWVDHRHWEFFTEFQPDDLPAGIPLSLRAEGLDGSGWILVDCQIVASFRGALVQHRFDLAGLLNDGKPHRLSIIFDTPPEEQGQIGRTSQSRLLKPRFSFSWDWCARFVPIGIWDALYLEDGAKSLEVVAATTTTASNRKSGSVIVRVNNASRQEAKVDLVLRGRQGQGKVEARRSFVLKRGENTLVLPVKNPRLWWPNGLGEQNLYELDVRDTAANSPLCRKHVGFKHVRWLPCEDAPPGARDLLCEINGKAIFLQGVNWTPVQMDYPAAEDRSYERLIGLYQKMGCNVLRVWGGAFLEKEIFYRLCDEAGILVWQEFPLCSAGIDNDPPRGRPAIRELAEVATDYVRRRQHHASLLLWCGGNELQSTARPGEPSRPLDESHPALAALRQVVEKEQPGIRFLPASPSGPVFFAERGAMGQGVHHHVHGPWDGAHRPDAEWKDYWTHDDSLLRAETGVAGAADVSLIERYAGAEKTWPPSFDNPWWRHSSAWWLQDKFFEKEMKGIPADQRLARFVELSQKKQAKALAVAAKACRNRFPKCAGFLVWMGHDAFPCPANTSIIDFDQRPKPAYHALRKVFRSGGPVT